jgi:uncharacterized RDD family membrane protein YckC
MDEIETGPTVSTSNTITPRYLACLLDTVVAGLLAIVTAKSLPDSQPLVQGLCFAGVFLLYFFLFEALLSRTPGKFSTGLRVVRMDGSPISFREAGIRTAMRVLEVNPALLGCVPAALSVIFSPRNQRFGDKIAGTLVVRNSERMPEPEIVEVPVFAEGESTLSTLEWVDALPKPSPFAAVTKDFTAYQVHYAISNAQTEDEFKDHLAQVARKAISFADANAGDGITRLLFNWDGVNATMTVVYSDDKLAHDARHVTKCGFKSIDARLNPGERNEVWRTNQQRCSDLIRRFLDEQRAAGTFSALPANVGVCFIDGDRAQRGPITHV